MKLLYLLGILPLFVSNFAVGHPLSKNAHPTGTLIVRFRPNVTADQKQAVRHWAKVTLKYESHHIPYEVLIPEETRANSKTLKSICEDLRHRAEVESCEVEQKLVPNIEPPANTHCLEAPTQDVLGNADNITKCIDKIQKQPAACEAVDNHGLPRSMGGKLSAFWGYDFVGVDVAREALASVKDQMTPARISTAEQVDLGEIPDESLSAELKALKNGVSENQKRNFIDPHGTQVASILAGKAPYGVALKAQYVAVGAGYLDQQATALEFVDRAIDRKAQMFTASHNTESNYMKEFFGKLYKNHVITVQSSGNYFPTRYENGFSAPTTIKVAQLSPLGGIANQSSSYPGVTIAAPGRNYASANGQTSLFGGTSGAQPVVSGCLANVVSLLPDLTDIEAKELVIKTAIPTLNSKQRPPINGVGTLNCLKLAEVGKRLQVEWPSNRTRIKADPTLFDFDAEAKQALINADGMDDSDNCDQKMKLSLLRRAFLFSSNPLEAAAKIATLYRKLGYAGNAFLYESVKGDVADARLEEIQAAVKADPREEPDFIRLVGEFYPKKTAILELLLNSPVPQSREWALYYTRLAPEKAKTLLLERFRPGEFSATEIFFEKYFNDYRLPAKDLFDACRERLLSWAKQAAGHNSMPFYLCFEATQYGYSRDTAATMRYLKNAWANAGFREVFLGTIDSIAETLEGRPDLFKDQIARNSIAMARAISTGVDWPLEDRRALRRSLARVPASYLHE